MRRVVVTGMGLLTPLACGVEATWERILASKSGAGTINSFDADHLVTNYACGPRRVSPFFIPSALINLASGQVSIKYGYKGPNHAVVTACSTGAHAIGDAALYAEVLGYGLSGDAHHITAPSPDGDGGFRSMAAALKRAGRNADELDYINAHGTSTMADTIELAAVARLMGAGASSATMSSTKSSIGHLLGAAGSVEAIFSILAIRDQVAPPTINLNNPEPDLPLDLAPNQPRERKIDLVLSNSFGFGGTNASLVMGKV